MYILKQDPNKAATQSIFKHIVNSPVANLLEVASARNPSPYSGRSFWCECWPGSLEYPSKSPKVCLSRPVYWPSAARNWPRRPRTGPLAGRGCLRRSSASRHTSCSTSCFNQKYSCPDSKQDLNFLSYLLALRLQEMQVHIAIQSHSWTFAWFEEKLWTPFERLGMFFRRRIWGSMSVFILSEDGIVSMVKLRLEVIYTNSFE